MWTSGPALVSGREHHTPITSQPQHRHLAGNCAPRTVAVTFGRPCARLSLARVVGAFKRKLDKSRHWLQVVDGQLHTLCFVKLVYECVQCP